MQPLLPLFFFLDLCGLYAASLYTKRCQFYKMNAVVYCALNTVSIEAITPTRRIYWLKINNDNKRKKEIFLEFNSLFIMIYSKHLLKHNVIDCSL